MQLPQVCVRKPQTHCYKVPTVLIRNYSNLGFQLSLSLSKQVDRDMSCDTAKENASVVESSVTERKEDMGNSDEPESSSHKASEGVDPSRSEEGGRSHDHVGDSPARRKSKLYGTRYFIIKSLSHENIQLSIEKGIWATQVMNEPILEDAFHKSGKVILIFSVNMSGFFQGYAQMMSSVGWRRDNVWSQGSSRSNPWGRSFKVKWLRLNDLPFQQTLHLKNPLNEYKPVKISRDCQELSPDVGEALCELLDRHNDLKGMNSIDMDNFPSKRPCVEPPCAVVEEEYNMPLVHPSWSQTPMLYPSMLYQHQSETNRFHLANQESNESLPASVPTEDDFLKMSYEEYLEVYGRNRKELYQPGSRSQKSSRSKRHEDDLNSSYGSNRSCSRKRAHQSSHKQSQC